MKFDAVVIGAGLNGLATAGLLARAGRAVMLVEARESIGGVAGRAEVHEGYSMPGLPLPLPRIHPLVRDKLALERHGLSGSSEPESTLAIGRHGPTLALSSDVEATARELGRGVAADAETYRAWSSFVQRARPAVLHVLDHPSPDLLFEGARDLSSALRTGLELWKLSRADLRELGRVLPMCVADWVGEGFESDVLKAALSGAAIRCSPLGPWSAGTAALLLLWECTRGEAVRGGPPALAEALAASARAQGVELRTGARATRIQVEGGKVQGVELEGGEVIETSRVAAACDPRTALIDLLPPRALRPPASLEIHNFRARGCASVVHLALSSPIGFRDREGETFSWARIGGHVDELERAFDAWKYRGASERPVLEVWMPTREGGAVAPDGAAVASVLAHFAPRDLEGGWTDAAREALGSSVISVLEEVAPGTSERIVGRKILAPPDLEARYGTDGGHLFHGDLGLDQLALRPGAHLTRGRTPVLGLFLCGRGSHPGPFVTCGPGALAAKAMLA